MRSTRPVVCGMMAGSVRKRDLIDKRRMRPGDRVLLTKGAAVEGTAIIARELGSRLRKLGMSAEKIESCRAYLDRISIIPEARQAARCPGTSAMHDVTEGGIATALEELSAAGGCRLRVDLDRIPVFPETRTICRLLGVHPLGLIGSGSLLICCRPNTLTGSSGICAGREFRSRASARLRKRAPASWGSRAGAPRGGLGLRWMRLHGFSRGVETLMGPVNGSLSRITMGPGHALGSVFLNRLNPSAP